MELKPAFKQTEVGVIPEDWGTSYISDLVRDGPKSGYSGRSGASGTGTPTLSLAATSSGRLVLNDTTVKYLVQTIAKESPLFLHPSDVLVQRSNTLDLVGTTAIFEGPAGTFVYPDLMMRLRFKRRVTGIWFWRYANSYAGRRFFRRTAAGSTGSMPKISGANLRGMLLPLPPLADQEAITKTLTDTDAFIESVEKLLTKKRQFKQGAMQELLTGKKRLPGFETTPGYKQTDIGVIPERWDVKTLGELFDITSSKRVFQSEWRAEGIPFYRARELAVLGETGWVKNELFISKKMYEAYRRTHGVPAVGDMLVTGVGTLGKVYVVSDDHEFYFKDGNIIWYRLSGRVQPEYLRQLYLTPLITRQIADASGGTTVGTYTIAGAKKTTIPFPSLVEQTAIAAILSDMDAEIAALEAKLTKVRALKQGMMQQLLSGSIRLV